MKKVISLVLCLMLCVCFIPQITGAAPRDVSFEEQLAQDLKSLGLFKGVSETEFDLGRAPTRVEALVMLIRLLGKETEAEKSNARHPFTDVPAWANGYVGYAYQNGLARGVSETTFGTDNADAKTYLTFTLRALGYSDENGKDFLWNNPYILAESVGILPSCVQRNQFLRADVASVSYAALSARIKDTTRTLAQKLIEEQVFTYEQYLTYYNPDVFYTYNAWNQELTAEQVYNKCSDSVFYLEVYDAGGYATGSGSGFFIDSDGTAVTNYHVLEGAYSATATLSESGAMYDVEGVYDYDAEGDWAVIKVKGAGFDALTISDGSTVKGGATVYAIGSPLGLKNTISQGLISNANRELDGLQYIQTSAAISHGSSGGALIDKYGEVIGITSAGFTDGENLGLALPISVISGYSRAGITTMTELVRGGNGTYGPSNSAQGIAAQKALGDFVERNANHSVNGNPAYRETTNTESGSLQIQIVNMRRDGLVCVEVREFIGRTQYNTTFTLSAGDTEVFIFEEIGGSMAYGEGTVYAPEFDGDAFVRFTETYGMRNKQAYEQLCTVHIKLGLVFVDLLFGEYFSGEFSVADFGFTRFDY